MPVSKLFKAILSFLLLFSFINYGHSQRYVLSSFTAEKELSSRQITCFFQDSKGFIWIGTTDGLNLYNANSIKVFKHDVKNKNSLLNNYVQNICEDNDGNIWIGTASGVDRFSPSSNTFFHFTVDEEKKLFGFKSKVYIDRKGNIWIGCENLFKYDKQQQQFKRIKNNYSNKYLGDKLSNFINGFYNDSKGFYWISTSDGLFLYNDVTKKFTRFDTPPTDDSYKKFGVLYSQVYEDKNNNLWVGTWGRGVFKILPEEKKLLSVSPQCLSLTYSSQQLNNHIIFWYASEGLVGVNEQNNLQAKITHQSNDNFSVRNDAITALFTDKQNQLWIGYEQSGIQLISPANQLIKTYSISSATDKHKITSVNVIFKKDSITYLGGWYSDALCKLNKDYKVEKWWDYLPFNQNKFSSNVGDIYADKTGNLWITTFNGLICMNERTGKIDNYIYDSEINNNRFIKILPDGDSVLWLSGYNNGLSRFSLRTHTLQMMGNKDEKEILWKSVFDKTGAIWCASNNGFLKKFDKQKRNFTAFYFDSLTEQSIYYDLAYDSAYNLLWVASSNGLLKVDLQSLHATLFTEKDGLPTSHVNLVCMDHQHRLWIGTDNGLSLFDSKQNSFVNFYENNGLSTNKIDHCLSVADDGMLYIGADNGFMAMDINALNNKKEISPVYITAVTESGNLLEPVVKEHSKIIELPYNQNAVSFSFAIADYINPEDNQLCYKLEDWDKEFIQTKKGEVNYNKLPPGKYIFRVKGINHNGIKNDTGDAIILIIHPPFWRTWWFIILVSAVILTLIVLAVTYISQRNLKEKLLRLEKEQAVEKERNRISKDMHDDLGSGLTKIAIMSEVVKKQIHEPEKAKQQLENISVSSRELVDNLQDIIWVLNPKNDTLENVAAYIREYALKFFEPFGTEVRFDYPESFSEIKLSEETRRNIFLAIKESCNNIAKHAWCNHLFIRIQILNREIIFSIKDDGKGFNVNTVRQFGNGLINMQSRIEQIGGNFTIISEEGKGTEILINIPV